MKDYTTGRAARELRVSQNRLRALCQAGMIAARATPGGHFRIPKSEIERLRRDGVPDPPPATPVEPQAEPVNLPTINPHRHPVLLAEPSEQAINSADEVVQLENEVKAIGLKRIKEENLDWFRDRQRRQDETKAGHARQVLQAKEERLRREWENTWLEYAMQNVPDVAPENARLPVHESVRQALANLSPRDPENVVEPLLRAAVEKGLRPWRRSTEIESAIQDARKQLPYWARSFPSPSEWELRAMQAAEEAINQLRTHATIEEVRAAAITAGRRVASEYQHEQECRNLVGSVFLFQTPNEQERARQAVKVTVEKLPMDTSRMQMERVRDEVLAPFRAAEETARVQAQAASTADFFLLHVDSYLNKIAADRGLRDFSGCYQEAQELKAEIRPSLIREILEEPLSLDDAYTLIETLIDRKLK
jgi:excisionase family DNA binding protein